jgi:asparagine synthase (glutamine-hydrolysing)
MLHDYLWSLRLGELHGISFSEELKARVHHAGEFLFQIQDERTGAVPLYGQNDGALILPLNNCAYHDFRPAVGATHYLFKRENLFQHGRWQEDLLWLFGVDSLASPTGGAKREDFLAGDGGYYTLRSSNGFVFTRCGGFRHRPSQADMLHVDLWWRGLNIALDAGTYSYNSGEPWADAFSGTAAHNTVTVDGFDQMERAGKFLWLPWLNGSLHLFQRKEELACFEGSHDGYLRLNPAVIHHRAVAQLGSESWLVIDRLFSSEKHSYRLHWLLADLPYHFDLETRHISLETPEGPYHISCGAASGNAMCSLVRADPDSARGWRAPFYNYREPALSFVLEQEASSAILWTLFSPLACAVHVQEAGLHIRCGEAFFEFDISGTDKKSLICAIRSGNRQVIIAQ